MVKQTSLKNRMVIFAGAVALLVFTAVTMITTMNSRKELVGAIYNDLLNRNDSYVHILNTIFKDREDTILSLRNDLELYQSPGQMWLHIANHSPNRVFNDPERGAEYEQSFQQKLEYYFNNSQLSTDLMTPQVRAMLRNIDSEVRSLGSGLAYFYIGYRSQNPDPLGRAYDQYQDSSLWVPDPTAEASYDPFIRPWYIAGREAGRNRVIFTEPYAERRTGEALIAASTSITIEGVRGTLAGAISIRPIMDDLLSDIGEQAHVTIISEGAPRETDFVSTTPHYIYSSRDSSLGERIVKYDDPSILHIESNEDLRALYDLTHGQNAGVLEWRIGGSDRLVAFHTVPVVGWKIFTSVARDDVLAGMWGAQRLNMTVSAIGLLILLFAIYIVSKYALRPLNQIRDEMRTIAQTGDLGRRVSVRSSDEVGEVAASVNTMLDNVAGPVKELGAQVRAIAQGKLGGAALVQSRGDIAELVSSFNQMNARLIEFEQTSRAASPLTGLPGGYSIEQEVRTRFETKRPFVFCMFDLDNFKPFNDLYGYSRGNDVIRETADILKGAIAEHGTEHGANADFCGHIGGDDFVIITTDTRYGPICNAVLERFDASIKAFYAPEDRAAGFISAKLRNGDAARLPIMTITGCAVSSEQLDLRNYIRIGEIAADLKKMGKKRPGSNLIVNHRKHEDVVCEFKIKRSITGTNGPA